MNKIIIYCLIKNNIPFYIGKTKNFNKRRYTHWKNYGKDITMEIVDKVSINEYIVWEKLYIQIFKNLGFKLKNKNKGGGGPFTHSKEARMKISKAIKNNKERGSKISKGKMGTQGAHKGKKFSQEHKDKIRKTRGFLKTRKITWKNGLDKPVIQYSLDGKYIKKFISAREALNYLGVNPVSSGQIGRCINGFNKTAYGYKWKRA